MFRAVRLLLVPALTLVVAAAAWAGPACDSEKASAEQASATQAADKAGCASVKEASAAKSGCSSAKTASAASVGCASKADKAQMADCVYCDFTNELKASKESVTVTTVATEHGVRLVFAGNNADGVEAAQAVASKAYSMVNAPAHCKTTQAKMADASCGGCKAGMAAFAGAEVTLENTKTGAEAMITVENDEQVEEVVQFFAAFQTTESSKGE